MQKDTFFSQGHFGRLFTSFLLFTGLYCPLGGLLNVQLMLGMGVGACVLLLASLTYGSRIRAIAGVALAVAGVGLQMIMPSTGMLGGWMEACKAIVLHANGVSIATALYSVPLTTMLAVLVALLAYAFSSKNAGFIPAAILTVTLLFCLGAQQKLTYLWYALPALCAVLMMVSKTRHENATAFRVFPFAGVVVLVSMLILPSQPVTLPPLHQGAMNLKQAISDYLFFTNSRNIFTLGDYGYYPKGSGQLGGEVEPSDYPVMMVKTDQKTLLRAVVKDEYTGRSWRDTSSSKRYLYVSNRWQSKRADVFLETLPPIALRNESFAPKTISVQVENGSASTLFTPAYLRDVQPVGDIVPYFNDASELFATRDLQNGDRYQVQAPIVEGGDNGLGVLINAVPSGNDTTYASMVSRYTRLPEHLEPRLFVDLNNIVGEANTPYDKAVAIQRHLMRYYRYTLTPQDPPQDQDFVSHFLYVSKEGYCTYFASAMTVYARMAGLPARYVEGFVANPTADGIAYLTGLHAHAWTEIYFDGFGWVPFDATPRDDNTQGERDNNPTPSPTPPPPEEQTPPESEPTPPPPELPPELSPDEPQPNEASPALWLWLLLLPLLAVGAYGYLRSPAQVIGKEKENTEKIVKYASLVYWILQKNKLVPKVGETPTRFAQRVDKQQLFAVNITPLWRVLVGCHYAGRIPGEKQVNIAQAVFEGLYHTLPLWQKIAFHLALIGKPNLYKSIETKAFEKKK